MATLLSALLGGMPSCTLWWRARTLAWHDCRFPSAPCTCGARLRSRADASASHACGARRGTDGQTKFNVINYSIVHSTKSSVSTLTCGVCALLAVLSGASGLIINGLPRFLLAGLLVYSGAGFPAG